MIIDLDFLTVLAEQMKAAANPLKLILLSLLMHRPMTATELVKQAGDFKQARVSMALSRLRWAGLVTVRRQGKYRIYALATNGLIDNMDRFLSQRKEEGE